MKTLSIFIFTILIMTACNNNKDRSKIDSENIDQVSLEVPSGETLRYQLATGIATEGGFSISSQPKNYSVSKIEWNNSENQLEYIYQSKEGFTGKVNVEIIEEISIGDSENNTQRMLNITIEVK
ncbi:hypothetical protein JKA74_17180 [Marivirga sp. S37H4]|uniref:Uncharacterized protein n=1 Tax=Marivirga aurantiaca TaxID=2802615 RepID=A0A934X1V9_9BACT|nr:hypothetical protein [Marivirga aurantiaca]MBK6266780.1 hypothetical protein [Marivirga aurantiaca]